MTYPAGNWNVARPSPPPVSTGYERGPACGPAFETACPCSCIFTVYLSTWLVLSNGVLITPLVSASNGRPRTGAGTCDKLASARREGIMPARPKTLGRSTHSSTRVSTVESASTPRVGPLSAAGLGSEAKKATAQARKSTKPSGFREGFRGPMISPNPRELGSGGLACPKVSEADAGTVDEPCRPGETPLTVHCCMQWGSEEECCW